MADMRQVIDPPSFTPTPYGLLTTVDTPPMDNEYWQNGVTYSPTCASTLGDSTYADRCITVTGAGGSPPPPAPLSGNVTTIPRGATPFTVYAEFDCAPVGNQQAQAKAETALSMSEPYQVERAFWTGIAGAQRVVFPHLAADATVYDPGGIQLQTVATNVGATGTGSPFVNGDLPNIETAIGLLEQALAGCYGGVGVLHVPELALPTLDAWNVVRASGPVMRTLNGNKVAVGGGYDGSGPSGQARAANSCWLYITGNVFMIHSNIRVRSPQSSASPFDRTTNTLRMIAERTYVLGWDCCHFAIQAALGVPRGN